MLGATGRTVNVLNVRPMPLNMKATEVIEELQRQVAEFGDGPLMVQDEMEPDWRYPVTDLEFDQANQAYTISASR